jgi:hypothetical protein
MVILIGRIGTLSILMFEGGKGERSTHFLESTMLRRILTSYHIISFTEYTV